MIETSTFVTLIELTTFMWVALWLIVAAAAFLRGQHHSVCVTIWALFFFCALPLVEDMLLGRPHYPVSRWFEAASGDPATRLVYCAYVFMCPPLWWSYGRTPRPPYAVNHAGRHIPSRWYVTCAKVISHLALISPALAVWFAPNAEQYLGYAAVVTCSFDKAASSYFSGLSVLCIASVLGGALLVSVRPSIATIAYVIPWVGVACWINGKRSIVLTAFAAIIVACWLSRAVSRGLLLVSVVVATAAFGVYTRWYQEQFREPYVHGNVAQYENFRLDYARDHVIRLAIYSELNPKEITLLPQRFATVVFYATSLVPRAWWPGKPWPYSVYLTSAALDLPIVNLGWGFTTSCLDEAIANLGWLGLIAGPLVIVVVCRTGDACRNSIMQLLTPVVASLLLVVQLAAFGFIAGVWLIVLAAYHVKGKTDASDGYSRTSLFSDAR